MLQFLPLFALILCLGVLHWKNKRACAQCIQTLERDLQHISTAMSQMTEIQMQYHSKLSARFEDLEERIIELNIPSQDSSLPLERRRQVLALARQGVGLEDIVNRLKAPAGEAELILNLRKYRMEENTRECPKQMNR